MTPCEKLGYEVGDRFVSQKTNKLTGLQEGEVLILKHDDGSDMPWFLGDGTKELIPVTLDYVVKQEHPAIKTGDTIEQEGKKYRVTFEEIPQYDFKPGMLCVVDWDGSEICVHHSAYTRVVYIENRRSGTEKVAYSCTNGYLSVGYVNTSNLRPE